MYLYPGIVAASSLSAPFFGGWLMERSIWMPFHVAVGLTISTLAVVVGLREKYEVTDQADVSTTEFRTSGDLDAIGDPIRTEEREGHLYASLPQDPSLPTEATPRGWATLSGQLYGKGLVLCYVVFFLKRLGFASQPFIYQYASQYLQWPLQRTTVLQFSRAAGAAIVNVVLIPGFSTCAINSDMVSLEGLDHGLVAVSASILAFGFWLLWIAQTSIRFFAGMGDYSLPM